MQLEVPVVVSTLHSPPDVVSTYARPPMSTSPPPHFKMEDIPKKLKVVKVPTCYLSKTKIRCEKEYLLPRRKNIDKGKATVILACAKERSETYSPTLL